ncbi:DUF3593 domain-containing protein [Prochlorococcus sp. MIT 1307]|uniref:DUF3593 domain-containing protein n=1 Tax=Prochlorococcus sp. MIT 1307 TaxID=3096219 RepID=UPI002A76344F|nr:DUF3593 domain-containing protein [Prochlorococcus sp. MIT 1307]
MISPESLLQYLAEIDPSPFFVLSLIPYLFFLNFAQRTPAIPKISLWGFRLTLLFVLMTIIFAVLALQLYDSDLTDIDPLHGAAESFLTLSDALVAIGFLRLAQKQEIKNS